MPNSTNEKRSNSLTSLLVLVKVKQFSFYTFVLCRKTGITHSMSRLPFLWFHQSWLCSWTPVFTCFGIADVVVQARTVGRQMEKAVAIDAPNLWRFVESHRTTCVRHHGVKSAVGKIIHPRAWRVVAFHDYAHN